MARIEYLAVRQLVKNPRGSILCLVGPPGVGKTSLGDVHPDAPRVANSCAYRSAACATKRRFAAIVPHFYRRPSRPDHPDDEEGRHRSIRSSCSTKWTRCPADFRGDPSAALMEAFDPELNHAFTDHYLDVEYDLSKVMFICTANVLHTIPQPLQDRMEMIRLAGYTETEEAGNCQTFPGEKTGRSRGPSPPRISNSATKRSVSSSATTRRKRASAASSGSLPTSAAKLHGAW